MESYQLSKNYTIRADSHLNNYILFKYNSANTVRITKTDYILLSALSNEPKNAENLANFLNGYEPEPHATTDNVTQVINYYLKKGFVETVNKKKKVPFDTPEQISYHPAPPGKTPALSFPTQVDVFLTRKCNMKCVHCSVNAGENVGNDLPIEYWKNIFDQLEQSKVLKVIITGGEPTLYHGFWELIDYIKDKKFYKCLLTNGLSLTDEAIRKLKMANISIGISMDGALEETHDAFRKKKGAFRKVMKTLEKLKNNQVPFDILSVVHRKNIYQMEGLFRIAAQFRAIGLFFYMIENVGRGKDAGEWKLSFQESISANNEFYKVKIRYPDIPSSYADPQSYLNENCDGDMPTFDESNIYCRAGNAYMAIDAEGTVYPCPYGVFLQKLPAGNSKGTLLKDIWNQGEWSIFREGVAIDQLSACDKCSEKSYCKLKKCRMRSLAKGDLYGEPFNCPIKTSAG